MHGEIGWHFPPTGGGRVDRFNDPGIAHFDGNPLVSLARETIQNSLDAKAGPGPVVVSFEIEEIHRRDALGREELAAAVTACLEELDDDGDDDKARAMLGRASDLLRRDRLPYLRVSDRKYNWLAPPTLGGAGQVAGRERQGNAVGRRIPRNRKIRPVCGVASEDGVLLDTFRGGQGVARTVSGQGSVDVSRSTGPPAR